MIEAIYFRHIEETDSQRVRSVMKDWWDGRDLTYLLPGLFFEHFQNTSYVAEHNGNLAGFLIGFLSQSRRGEAYIHMIGIHPDYRKQGLASELYSCFFQAVKDKGCHTVRCITSPTNRKSIAFHTRMGFEIEPGVEEIDGTGFTGRPREQLPGPVCQTPGIGCTRPDVITDKDQCMIRYSFTAQIPPVPFLTGWISLMNMVLPFSTVSVTTDSSSPFATELSSGRFSSSITPSRLINS